MTLKKSVMFSLGILLFSSVTYAAENKKPVSTWTCEDFLAIEESYQPTAVGVVEALNYAGNPEAEVLSIDGIEQVTPMVIDACKKDGKASFREKVHAEWDKVKKDL